MVALAALVIGGATVPAHADDTFKLAAGQRGNWDTAICEVGQRAGIFKKHGLALDILWTQGAGETLQAVLSGSVDIGIGVGIMGVLSAYSKGAPVRVIGAETTGAADLFWYVPASSSIKSLKDTDGKTIAYSTNGSSTHGIVTAFIKQYDLKAKPTATGGPAPTLTQVMTNQIDVGWAAPPFGLQQLDEGKIRVIASGNDATIFKGQTVRLLVTNVATLKDRKSVIDRFMKAYRNHRLDVFERSSGTQDLRGVRRHLERDGEAHARQILSEGGGGPRPARRARHHRARCRRAQVHRRAADEESARRADPDSAASVGACRGRVDARARSRCRTAPA